MKHVVRSKKLMCFNILVILLFIIISCKEIPTSVEDRIFMSWVTDQSLSEEELIRKATSLLAQAPTPITLYKSERSAGGIHDFYSEGDYWWPDPDNPTGPYIRKDGQSNPENFTAHRLAMRNLNEWVSTLAGAYISTLDQKYAEHAILHLRKFFLDESTLMNPNLLYAQAIQGRHTGRGIGIIDTIHLIEVAKVIMKLHENGAMMDAEFKGYQNWFETYADWMNSHPYGLDEKDHGNNHSTWWAAQIAAFAELTGREDLKEVARVQFKKLLPLQMKEDGSFPDELSRTKPYNYSLFNLEGYAVLCELASNDRDLWTYEGETGSIKKAFEFMLPYIKEKDRWPYNKDVEHFDELPTQSVGLWLATIAYESDSFYEVYKKLDPMKKSQEIKRTFPLWHTIHWL